MKILVCGGRDFGDREMLFGVLDSLQQEHANIHVIEGAASGADTLAGEWAIAREAELTEFPADWARHGRRAGPLRNAKMLDEGQPGLVVAFPGGIGTADMVRRATEAGIPVLQP